MRVCKDLGYFCGLIIGDGSLCRGQVRLETTDEELYRIFVTLSNRLFPELRVYTYRRVHGFSKKENLIASINSKQIHNLLRPFKLKDFHWKIPTFLNTHESMMGFLQGIYDAEGGIYKPQPSHTNPYLYLHSKHKDNLEQISAILQMYGIEARIWQTHKNEFELSIGKKASQKRFFQLIGFRLSRKQPKEEWN